MPGVGEVQLGALDAERKEGAFCLVFFSQLFVRPPQTAILLFAFLFHEDGLDLCLLYNVMNLCP